MVYRNSNKTILDSYKVAWCVSAFSVIVTNRPGRILGYNGKVGRGDSIAMQGMWRPALGRMHHTFSSAKLLFEGCKSVTAKPAT
jgi:hypothetical protein